MSLNKSVLVLFSAILGLSCIQALPTNREIETIQENPDDSVTLNGLLSKLPVTDLGSPILKLDHSMFVLPFGFVLALPLKALDNPAVNSNKLEPIAARPRMSLVIPLYPLTHMLALEPAKQRIADAESHSENKVTLSTTTTTEALPVLAAPDISWKKPQQPIEKRKVSSEAVVDSAKSMTLSNVFARLQNDVINH